MARSDPQATLRPMTAAAVDLAAALPEQAEVITQVLLHLNQLSAILAGHSDAGDATRVLSALYRQLTHLASQSPDAPAKVQPLVDQLNTLAAEGKIYASPTRPSSPRRRRRTNTPTYAVRHGPRGERLVEHRPGSEKDFYITHHDYDVAIRALAKTAQTPVRFDLLVETFLAEGGTPTRSAYPLRVVLRFLRQLDPSLIAGQRGRYRLAVKPASFGRQAQQAWKQAATG